VRLNCIDELFDESIIQKRQVVLLLNVVCYYVDWFVHQCFLVQVLYKVLFLKTSYEHQDNVNKWHISYVVEEHSSILFVDAINDEHDFIFFDQHKVVWCIDHLVRRRHFSYESIQIINKWIITIRIVDNASSKKIVKRLINKHTCIFKWSQICHICKFNIRDIIICCFLIVDFFFIVVFWFSHAIFCLDIIQNINVNYFFDNEEKSSWFQNRVSQSLSFLLIALSIWWFDKFNNVFTFFSIMHVFARALSFFAFITLCRDRERRFVRLRLWLILKNDDISMFNYFYFLFNDVFIFTSRFFEMNVSFNRFFAKFNYRRTLKLIFDQRSNLMSKVRTRLLRFFQSVTQFLIWFLNDDCFKIWNFSCICFFICSSIFLYLIIKNCKIFFMKADINFEKMYVLVEARIASSTLSILWVILRTCFFFRLYCFTLAR
jgi:hypothetical protein